MNIQRTMANSPLHYPFDPIACNYTYIQQDIEKLSNEDKRHLVAASLHQENSDKAYGLVIRSVKEKNSIMMMYAWVDPPADFQWDDEKISVGTHNLKIRYDCPGIIPFVIQTIQVRID